MEYAPRLSVRVSGVVVPSEPLVRLAEGQIGINELGRRQPVDLLRDCERSFEEPDGVDVRVPGSGAATSDPREPPRVLEPLRVEVVHRQKLGVVLLREGALADRIAHPRVQLPPPTEREPFVCRVPHERVPESVRAGSVGRDELVETTPGSTIEPLVLPVQQRRHQLVRKRRPEDRRVSQEADIRRREPVDLGRDDPVDRRRQVADAACRAGGLQQLPKEQRVAARALGHDRLARGVASGASSVAASNRAVRSISDSGSGRNVTQRSPSGAMNPVPSFSTGDRDRATGRDRSHRAAVLEVALPRRCPSSGRPRSSPGRDGLGTSGQAAARPTPRACRAGTPRRARPTSGVDSTAISSGIASSGNQGSNSGAKADTRIRSTVRCLLTARGQVYIERFAQQRPEGRIGRAHAVEDRMSSSSSRTPRPACEARARAASCRCRGGPTISMTCPWPSLVSAIAWSMAAISSWRPISGEIVLVRAHLHVRIGPTRYAVTGCLFPLTMKGSSSCGLEPDAATRRGSNRSPTPGRDGPWPSPEPRGSPRRPSPCMCAGSGVRCRPRRPDLCSRRS